VTGRFAGFRLYFQPWQGSRWCWKAVVNGSALPKQVPSKKGFFPASNRRNQEPPQRKNLRSKKELTFSKKTVDYILVISSNRGALQLTTSQPNQVHMTMNKLSAVLAVSAAVLTVSQSIAATISGDITFTGKATLNAAPSTAVSINSYSGLTVDDASGDYTTALGQTVTFSPFTFAPSGAVSGLWSVGGFTYNLSSVTTVTRTPIAGGATLLTIAGLGTVTGNGFTPTPSSFSFTFQGKKATAAFTAYTTAVPEPTSWALVSGLGLAGFAFYRRARK
jgi:PEP-CTERM motif